MENVKLPPSAVYNFPSLEAPLHPWKMVNGQIDILRDDIDGRMDEPKSLDSLFKEKLFRVPD